MANHEVYCVLCDQPTTNEFIMKCPSASFTHSIECTDIWWEAARVLLGPVTGVIEHDAADNIRIVARAAYQARHLNGTKNPV